MKAWKKKLKVRSERLSAYITPGSKVRLLLALFPSRTPPHLPSPPHKTHLQTAMSPTTAISVNLPPRPTPSSIVEAIQRSPVLSPRIADPRQQRSGSLRPSSPPQRPATPPLPPVEQKSENGITKSGVRTTLRFSNSRSLMTSIRLYSDNRYGNLPTDSGLG